MQQSGTQPGVVSAGILAVGAAPDPEYTALVQNDDPIVEGPATQLLLKNTNAESTATVFFVCGETPGEVASGVIGIAGHDSMDIPADSLIIGNFSDTPAGVSIIADGQNAAVNISADNNMNVVGQITSSFNGDFDDATYGWASSAGNGLILAATDKPAMIAGSQFVMTFSPSGMEFLGNALPYNNGVETLGSNTNRWGELFMEKVITPGATTGAVTINAPAGSVNFAGSSSSLVVTNSLVTADSVIVATVASNDATFKAVQAVAGSGSFTLYPDVAPTSQTRVNFWVVS